jgi:hypothetical protein
MSTTWVDEQPTDAPGSPERTNDGNAPIAYINAADATTQLDSRWGLVPPKKLGNGHMLAASMWLDGLAPFQGVKLVQSQEREFPRTYKIGYPNMIGAPIPVLGVSAKGGVWLLNYEAVIPQQIVDAVCLEAYRMVSLPLERGISREAISGASVAYTTDSQIDQWMFDLISPFLQQQASMTAWPNPARF